MIAGRLDADFRPNRRAEQKEIAIRHARELHFVGDWHTHAEAEPTPSLRDTQSMRELVANSHHMLNGFVLVIVGTSAAPTGLSISVVDRTGVHQLHQAIDVPRLAAHRPLPDSTSRVSGQPSILSGK